MKVVDVNSWAHFKSEIAKLRLLFESLKSDKDKYVSDLLFRGQADSKWPLWTTLDRGLKGDFKIVDYRDMIFEASMKALVKMGNKPLLATSHVIRLPHEFFNPEGIEWLRYMAFLRHHSFPSPLLDWTTSID